MISSMDVNLPLADIERSRSVFNALGFAFNDTFCDQATLAMTISDRCVVMLLGREKFQSFTPRKIADAHRTSQVLAGLEAGQPRSGGQHVHKAVAHGAGAVREP